MFYNTRRLYLKLYFVYFNISKKLKTFKCIFRQFLYNLYLITNFPIYIYLYALHLIDILKYSFICKKLLLLIMIKYAKYNNFK